MADLFGDNIKKKKGPIPNGKVPISLPLDHLIREAGCMSESTSRRDLQTFKSRFDLYLGIKTGTYVTGISLALVMYTLQGRVSLK